MREKRLHSLQLLVLRVISQSLTNAQVGENLLATTKDGVELVGSLELLDKGTHARLGQTSTTEEVDGSVCHAARDASAPALEESNLTGEELCLVLVVHLGHLEGHVLQPRLGRLALGDDSSELGSDNGLTDQGLAKGLPLVGPHHQLGADSTRGADGRAAHDPSLVVEVGQNDGDTSTFLSDEVLGWHLGLIVHDVRGTSSGAVRSLDLLRLDTATASWDTQNGKAFLLAVVAQNLDGRGEVVGKHTVCDPLLGSVDDVVRSIGRPASGRLDATENVGSCESLSDRETDELLTGEDRLNDLLLELVGTEVHDGWQTNDHTSLETVTKTTCCHANELLGDDELTEVVKLFWLDVGKELAAFEVLAWSHSHSVDTELAHLLDELDVGSLAIGLASLRDLVNTLVDKLSHLSLQSVVVLLVVRGVVLLLQPSWFGVRHLGRRSGRRWNDLLGLAGDLANDQTLVLRSLEHLVSVETVEGLGGVLTCDSLIQEH